MRLQGKEKRETKHSGADTGESSSRAPPICQTALGPVKLLRNCHSFVVELIHIKQGQLKLVSTFRTPELLLGMHSSSLTTRRSIGHVGGNPESRCSWSQKRMHGSQKACREAQPGSTRGASINAKQIGQRKSSRASVSA